MYVSLLGLPAEIWNFAKLKCLGTKGNKERDYNVAPPITINHTLCKVWGMKYGTTFKSPLFIA